MYVYSRNRVPNVNDEPQVLELAPKLAVAASEATGRPVTSFQQMFGPGVGTVSWSAVVNDMVDLGDLSAKLAADSGFQQQVDAARPLFATMPEDILFKMVANSIERSDNAYYASTAAVGLPGKNTEVATWGTEVQAHYAANGFAVMFGIASFGPVNGVGFMLAADTLAELDAFNEFRSSDATAIAQLGRSGDLFVAGSGQSSLLRRLG